MTTKIYLGNPPQHVIDWIKSHSQPASHADTRYKYANDTEWHTVSITGTISGSSYTPTTQIPDVGSVVELEIGSDVTSIGDYAFYNCSGLASVTIPNSVKSIGNAAFYSCSGLTSVTTCNSVENIADSAFTGCNKLTSVTMLNVTSIGTGAFLACSGLTSVTIGSEIQEIGTDVFATYGSPVTLTIDKFGYEVRNMGEFNGWFGLPSGSTIVCINDTIPIE